MLVTLKGIDTVEVSKPIEMPDMAELLAMPYWNLGEAETIYKYGSDFQRSLLDLAPLRHDKENVVVECDVRFMYPNAFAVTKRAGWHMDGNIDGGTKDLEEDERVHLFTSQCSSMTEFLSENYQVEFGENMSMIEFSDFLNEQYRKGIIKGTKMQPNRFYTFSNHFHTATPHTRVEFRFIFRIVETNVKTEHVVSYPKERIFTTFNDSVVHNISRQDGNVVIHLNGQLTNLLKGR